MLRSMISFLCMLVVITAYGVDFSDVTDIAGVSCTGYSIGVAWGDYDNDGDIDLYVANFNGANVLYRNNGDGTFTDVTSEAGVGYTGHSWGVAWGDYDNDGDIDLYVANYYEANVLYRNNGDGTFTDITGEAGVGCAGHSKAVAWGDYDNDGDIDLYVANVEANVLYRNNGDGTFTDVTGEAGVGYTGHSWGVAWGDYDNDGDIDLYVANYGANVLYRNNGDGTFTDVTDEAGVGYTGESSGVAWGDYDNDGDLDLYVANYEANVLYRNNGDGTFTDVTGEAGVGYTGDSRGVAWGDYDNDGDLDLYVANWGEANVLYRNNGDGTFTMVGAGVGHTGYSRGVAWGDYDNDGDLDLYVAGGGNVLYRNNGNLNHWLQIRLHGTISNRSAIGTKVKVIAH